MYPVDRLSVYRGTNKHGEGYYCSRCKKEVTIYGYPKTDEDKAAYKAKMKVAVRGHSVSAYGDLTLIDTVYRCAVNSYSFSKPVHERWCVFDYYGKYVAAIWVEHDTAAMYEVFEPFEKRLKKEKLCAVRCSNLENAGIDFENLERGADLRVPLERSLGWKFDKNGKIY